MHEFKSFVYPDIWKTGTGFDEECDERSRRRVATRVREGGPFKNS
jgi:hypothetical protein